MSSECDRWIELADREAVGEPLPEAARAFQRAHVALCAECAGESALWRAMRPAAVEGAPSASEVEEVLRGVAEQRQRSQFVARRRSALLAAAAVPVACAAAGLLWLRSPPKPAAVVEKSAPAVAAVASTAALSPTASCAQPLAGVTVCLGPETQVTRRALEGADRLLEIERGRVVVSLVPQPAGTTFSIGTGAGRVTAVGTIFAVEVSPDGSAVARVIHGRVWVRGKDDVPRALKAGEALRLGGETPTPLTAEDRARDLALLALSGEEPPAELQAPAPRAPSASGAAAPQEPQGLLERARELRARGKFAEAAEVYRKVHASGPQSPSGLAALVSLGELLLSPLNDPQGALTAFDAYLAQGGALAQEAAFGRARALRALKRPAEERRAIERYLATYPDAPQGRVLRHRLAALGK